jgi:hypothetical protein
MLFQKHCVLCNTGSWTKFKPPVSLSVYTIVRCRQNLKITRSEDFVHRRNSNKLENITFLKLDLFSSSSEREGDIYPVGSHELTSISGSDPVSETFFLDFLEYRDHTQS